MIGVLLALNFSLAGADLAQTVNGLAGGSVREANPILAGLSKHPAAFGAVKMGVDAAAFATVWHLRKAHPRLAVGLFIGLAVAQGWAIAHNARHLRGGR